MVMRNKNLITVNKVISSQISALLIGGQVPAGMTRWVTFMALDVNYDSKTTNMLVHVASVNVSDPTMASLIATANSKWRVNVDATEMSRSNVKLPVKVPKGGPDIKTPLFSIGAEKWMGVFASMTTANLFVQYYEE